MSNQSTAPRGCAECGEQWNHKETCTVPCGVDKHNWRGNPPVLEFERVPSEPVGEQKLLPLICQVAQKVFGYEMRVVYPEWYKGLPVYCFYDPDFAQFGMTYSWDANACNASMYRNGNDGEMAEHLPRWDWEDSGTFLQVVERMTERGYHFRLYSYRTPYRQTDDPFRPTKEEQEHLEYEAEFMPYRSDHSERYIVRAEWAAKAVCEAAIKAVDGRIQPNLELRGTKL